MSHSKVAATGLRRGALCALAFALLLSSALATASTPLTISGTPVTSVVAEHAYSFKPSAHDSDDRTVRFSISNKPWWATFSSSTGQLQSSNSRRGTYGDIVICVSDGTYRSCLPAFALKVTVPSAPPVIKGTPPSTATVGHAYSFQPVAYDPNGLRLTFMVWDKPSWLSLDRATGRVYGTPTAADVGGYSHIGIVVSNGYEQATLLPTFSIKVSGASGSAAPTISGSPSTKAQVGQAYSFTPTVQNSSGQALGFSIQNKPAWASFSIANGSLTGTPSAADVGTDSNIAISVANTKESSELSPFSIAVSAPSASPPPAGGATLVFSYPNGFSGATNAIRTVGGSSEFSGSVIDITSGATGQHEGGATWYGTALNITTFTTDFTFQITPSGYGVTFIIQNDPRGLEAVADSNGIGYFAYAGQPAGSAIQKSIAIAFDATPNSGADMLEATGRSLTGLYADGGEPIDNGITPVLDLVPQGINLQNGDVMDAHVTYDGAILTMVLTDTHTGAKAGFSWPVDIPSVVGGNTAYVGFGAGTIPAVAQTLNSWSWWQGINSRLASPTFSVSTGSYTSAQTVSISGPAGASIYYTTNGKPPTTSSALYTGPITVSSNEYVQAIAVETNYTDSFIASANYSFGSAGTPAVDFPNGFASAGNLISTVGMATISGSAIQLTNSTPDSQTGAAWYVSPVNVDHFTTSFTLTFTNASSYGMAFVIQNQNPPSTDGRNFDVSGGPYELGLENSGLGYQNTLASVAVKFDLATSPGNTTGLYTNGAAPTGSQTPITGIKLASGDPINVTLTYDGTTLSMSMKDTVSGGSFSTSWPVNIPQIVGGDSAYIGFTGTTYFNLDTIQKVTALTFQN